MPYKIVGRFEKVIAEYAGSKYAVAVESCSAALFLSCLYCRLFKSSGVGIQISIPKFTYPGVACSIINAGHTVKFLNTSWQGTYPLHPFKIIDSALRFKQGMFEGELYCISFHAKKHLPIGRGGMILTNNKYAYQWLKKTRFDGRAECPLSKDQIKSIGWNMYMTPEQAARGLMLFEATKEKDLPDLDSTEQKYPDLSKIGAYK